MSEWESKSGRNWGGIVVPLVLFALAVLAIVAIVGVVALIPYIEGLSHI
jgi:hypothetical protein